MEVVQISTPTKLQCDSSRNGAFAGNCRAGFSIKRNLFSDERRAKLVSWVPKV